MTMRSSGLSKHAIVAMLQNDGYIAAEKHGKTVKHIIYINTVDGFRPLICISNACRARLIREGVIKFIGDGKFKLAIDSPDWAKDMIVDPETGANLKPGKPDECEGNGNHVDVDGNTIECCCDECDYYLDCYPDAAEYRKEE